VVDARQVKVSRTSVDRRGGFDKAQSRRKMTYHNVASFALRSKLESGSIGLHIGGLVWRVALFAGCAAAIVAGVGAFILR